MIDSNATDKWAEIAQFYMAVSAANTYGPTDMHLKIVHAYLESDYSPEVRFKNAATALFLAARSLGTHRSRVESDFVREIRKIAKSIFERMPVKATEELNTAACAGYNQTIVDTLSALAMIVEKESAKGAEKHSCTRTENGVRNDLARYIRKLCAPTAARAFWDNKFIHTRSLPSTAYWALRGLTS